MKGKLAVLGFLCAAITVGGVYATWTFAEKETPAASTTVNVAMTGITGETEKGTLSVTVMGANGFTLSIDDSNNDHVAEVKKEGAVTVTFTPAASASQDVKDNGIDVQCVISYAPYAGGPATLVDWMYEEQQIFNIISDENAPIRLNQNAAVKGENGEFVWTIPANEIGIELATAFKIDTKEKYDALNAELAKGHFVLTVSEYTAPAVNPED